MIERLRRFEESEIAKEREKIIKFYIEFGEKATKKAFGVDRKLISKWRKRVKEREGKLCALEPISTRPNKFRTSQIDYRIIAKIKELREKYYRLGKYKIKVFLDEFCKEEGLKTISASTIGLIIKKNNMFWQPAYNLPLHNKYTKDRTRTMVKYSPKEQEPGTIIADVLTAVESGVTRYFFDAVDVATKFGFSYYFNKQTKERTLQICKKFGKKIQ